MDINIYNERIDAIRTVKMKAAARLDQLQGMTHTLMTSSERDESLVERRLKLIEEIQVQLDEVTAMIVALEKGTEMRTAKQSRAERDDEWGVEDTQAEASRPQPTNMVAPVASKMRSSPKLGSRSSSIRAAHAADTADDDELDELDDAEARANSLMSLLARHSELLEVLDKRLEELRARLSPITQYGPALADRKADEEPTGSEVCQTVMQLNNYAARMIGVVRDIRGAIQL